MNSPTIFDYFNLIFFYALESNGIPTLPGESQYQASIAWSIDRAIWVSESGSKLELLKAIITSLRT